MSKLGTIFVVLEVIEVHDCSECGGYVESPIKESWGIEALQEAQARWENSGCRTTTTMREEFYDRSRGYEAPWKIEFTFRYSARYSEV